MPDNFKSNNKIVSVAIRAGGKLYKLPIGNGHHHVAELIPSTVVDTITFEYGFVDAMMAFRTRKEAAEIALYARQLKWMTYNDWMALWRVGLDSAYLCEKWNK